MKYFRAVPHNVYAAQERLARMALLEQLREMRASILAVDPEATFTELHDEILVECRNEHKEAVVRLLTGGQP